MNLFLVALVVPIANPAPEQAWPGFRGSGNGCTTAKDLPLKWSPTENLAWKIDLPGYGQSCPVVWKDRVYVTAVDGKERERGFLMAFDAHTREWLSRVEAHDGWAGTIDSRPDLGLFATGGSDGKVRLWAWEGVGPPAPVAPGATEEFRQSYAPSFRFQPTEEA